MHNGTNCTHPWKSAGLKLLEKPAILLSIIAVIGVAAYSNTLHAPFVFDDQSSITENPVIRSLDNFLSNSTGYAYNPRRFIGYLSFALNYRLGGLDVTGYHAVNLAVHISNALLVYALVHLTLSSPFLAEQTGKPANTKDAVLPFLAAILFVAHPLQTQAITYTVQRLTSLSAFFSLLSLVLYARMRLFDENGTAGRPKRAMLLLLSLAALVLAMKTKEIAFTMPIVVLLYEFSFYRGKPWKRLIMLAPFALTLIIIPLSMLNARKPLGELLSDMNTATMLQTDVSRGDYLLTQFGVILTYIRLLFFPLNQNLDYDYPIRDSLIAPWVIFPLLFLLALLGLAVYLYYRSAFNAQCSTSETQNSKPKTQNSQSTFLRLMAFGICWFFITLAVESSVIPIVDVIFEHRAYFPSVGMFIAIATACVLIYQRLATDTYRKIALFFFASAVLVLAILTYQRNSIWNDAVTLWEDVVKKSPNKVRGYNNLGAALSATERLDESIRVLKQAIAIKPDHAEAYYNLGRVYLLHANNSSDAVRMLTRALELNPDSQDVYVNLAAAYTRSGKYEHAVALLETKISKLQDRADAHFNLGVAYHCLADDDKAARELAVLKVLDPGYADRLAAFMSRPYVSASHP